MTRNKGYRASWWGHAFGLQHVADSCNLTMAPAIVYCQILKRDFGWGDMRGIMQK